MTKPKQKQARELAEEHWNYLETVILQQLQVTRKLFIDGFIHGYKHGKEASKHMGRAKPTPNSALPSKGGEDEEA